MMMIIVMISIIVIIVIIVRIVRIVMRRQGLSSARCPSIRAKLPDHPNCNP